MGKNVKYSMINLPYEKETDVAELSKFARNGWHLTGKALWGSVYKLERGASENVMFDVDYFRGSAEEVAEYLEMMAAAGWEHVLEVQNFYLFKAQPDTVPIHSEAFSLKENQILQKYDLAKQSVGLVVLVPILPIFIWVLSFFVELDREIFLMTGGATLLIFGITLFCVLQYFYYRAKVLGMCRFSENPSNKTRF